MIGLLSQTESDLGLGLVIVHVELHDLLAVAVLVRPPAVGASAARSLMVDKEVNVSKYTGVIVKDFY